MRFVCRFFVSGLSETVWAICQAVISFHVDAKLLKTWFEGQKNLVQFLYLISETVGCIFCCDMTMNEAPSVVGGTTGPGW